MFESDTVVNGGRKMPYQSINDLDIFYEEIGWGEPILFLHSGYSRGVLAFSGQIQPFYAAGYRCLYPDYRGMDVRGVKT